MTRRIALTGGIASGKSTVARLLAERGAVIIDSDVLAREVVEPGTPGLSAIRARFGDGVIDDTGRLNRAALGAIVFSDSDARRDLEAITHPAIRTRAEELRIAAPPDAVVIDVIPLLVEAGLVDRFDLVVVVDVPPDVQRHRVRARDQLSDADVHARLRSQASREARLAVADAVIENSGDLAQLERQVDDVWTSLAGRRQTDHSSAGPVER